jgi:hypothetical protein
LILFHVTTATQCFKEKASVSWFYVVKRSLIAQSMLINLTFT